MLASPFRLTSLGAVPPLARFYDDRGLLFTKSSASYLLRVYMLWEGTLHAKIFFCKHGLRRNLLDVGLTPHRATRSSSTATDAPRGSGGRPLQVHTTDQIEGRSSMRRAAAAATAAAARPARRRGAASRSALPDRFFCRARSRCALPHPESAGRSAAHG